MHKESNYALCVILKQNVLSFNFYLLLWFLDRVSYCPVYSQPYYTTEADPVLQILMYVLFSCWEGGVTLVWVVMPFPSERRLSLCLRSKDKNCVCNS